MENPEKNTPPSPGVKKKVVQTFAEDMAGALENSPGMEIKKIIHGEEEREAERQNVSPVALKNRLFLIFGFVSVFIATGLMVFFLTRGEAPTVFVPPQFVPLIFTDESQYVEVVDLNKDQLSAAVLNNIESSRVKTGGVGGIYLTENKKVIGLSRFLTLIKASFAPNFNYVDNNFLLGFANNNANDFFVLLKVQSVADIFGSMKSWEDKMFSDLHGFFNIPITPASGPLLTKDFEDGIVENKNARILYDADHNIVMMYVFPDDNSVIITNTSEVVEEIVVRLAQNQIKKD
jgi:hypothetical protein